MDSSISPLFISKFKQAHKDLPKVEKVIGHIGYNEDRIFTNLPEINYKDTWINIQGEMLTENLFEINSSIDIQKKLIDPVLDMYRK